MDGGPAGWGNPLYERVLAGLPRGSAVLDVGCGPGVFAEFAAARGMRVTGVDADRSAVAAASKAVPEALFLPGDAHDLAHAVGVARFDLVALVQVLAHVTNPVKVLGEAARTGGRVRASVWGHEAECDVRVFGEALAGFLPPRRERGGPPPLTEPGRLRRIAGLAGLEIVAVDEVVCVFDYPDADALTGPVLDSALGRHASAKAGAVAVRDAVLAACAPFREGRGYRLHNLFRVLDALPAHSGRP